MYRIGAFGAGRVFRKPSHHANGNTYDLDGRLITCEHATGRVVRLERDGQLTVVASHFDGKALHSPNDVVVSKSGQVLFTDPDFGRITAGFGGPRPGHLPFQGVYRWDERRQALELIADDFEGPNGLCFSADGDTLYVNDTRRHHVRFFRRRDDEFVDAGVWAEVTGEGAGRPDGMKIDAAGNLYCTGPGGIHIFASTGASLGVVRTPSTVGNFTFGDDDLRTVYVCATSVLYSFRVTVPGVPVF